MTQVPAEVRKTVARSGFANPLTLAIYVSDEDYVLVYADDELLEAGTDYSITGLGSDTGVEIEIIGAEDVNNYVGYTTFTAMYDPPIDQLAALSGGGGFGQPFETALDQQNRRLQAVSDRTKRAIKMPVFIDEDVVLPPPVDGYAPAWDEDAIGFVWVPVTAGVVTADALAAAAAAAASVLEAETAQAAAEDAQAAAEDAQAAAEAAAAAIENGLPKARVVATSNVDLSAPGATIDGVAMVAGETFLAMAETDSADNGPYTWNGAATAATRQASYATYDKIAGQYFSVMEGTTYADTLWSCTSNKGGTLGTTALTFRIETPLDARKASFRVHNNGSAQSGIASGVVTKITWDTAAFNIDTLFVSTKWTPPAGTVWLNLTVQLTAGQVDGANTIALIYKNGTELTQGRTQNGGTSDQGVSVSVIDQCNGTDYYEAYFYSDGTGDKTISGAANLTYFQGTMV